MMTAPPRMNRTFGSTSNIMIKANELEYNTQMYVDFLAKFTGRPKEQVRAMLASLTVCVTLAALCASGCQIVLA